jgi:hypothetical protein
MSDGLWMLGLVGAMFVVLVVHAMFPQARRNREYWARRNGDDVDPRYWEPRYRRAKRQYRRKRDVADEPE